MGFAPIFAAPKLAELFAAGQGATLRLTKNRALLSEPFGNCELPKYSDIAAKLSLAGRAWRSSPLMEAIAIIFQAIVLVYHTVIQSEIYIPRNALAPASLPNLKYKFPKQKYKILKSTRMRTYKLDRELYFR